jgi:hypothetical protein
MWLPDHRQVLGQINTDKLLEFVVDIPEQSWNADTRPKNNFKFRNTNTIWFKTSPLSNDKKFYTFDCNQHLDQQLLNHYEQLICDLLTLLPGRIIKSGILRISPGQSIDRHIDGEHELHKFCHRIMIPMSDSKLINLYFSNLDQNLNSYDLLEPYNKHTVYTLNSFLPHWVDNVSDHYYYCYVGDIYPDYLSSMIEVFELGQYDRQKFQQLAIDSKDILTYGLSRWVEIHQQQKLFWANWKSC